MNDHREERIRPRAHQLWENAGRPEGWADDHWAQAAQEIDHADSTASRANQPEPPSFKPPGAADV